MFTSSYVSAQFWYVSKRRMVTKSDWLLLKTITRPSKVFIMADFNLNLMKQSYNIFVKKNHILTRYELKNVIEKPTRNDATLINHISSSPLVLVWQIFVWKIFISLCYKNKKTSYGIKHTRTKQKKYCRDIGASQKKSSPILTQI